MIYNFDDQVKQLDKKFVHISNKKLSINKNVKIYLNKIIKKLEKEKCSEIMNMEFPQTVVLSNFKHVTVNLFSTHLSLLPSLTVGMWVQRLAQSRKKCLT